MRTDPTRAGGAVARTPRSLLAALVVAVVLAGCSNAAAGVAAAPTSPAPTASATRSAAPPNQPVTASPSPTRPKPLPGPPAVAGLSWQPVGTNTARGPVTYLARTDGGAVALLWIDTAAVSFRLIPGWAVPEGSPVAAADRSPSTWVPRMVAAFNGGFLLKDGVGGYYYDHQMVRAMRPGYAALDITSNGRLTVGAWGRDLALTPQTVAVRQNLPLLVDHYQARTSSSDTASTWGIANGGLWTANRSALGQLADGSLVYAYGANVRPAAMSAAMTLVRAREAMMLDMNRSWPGGFVYEHPASGVTGQRIHPQEWHSASVYYSRFTKDFIAVLLR